ncbi:quinone oxidoreductase family protein [Companilactobacillus kimchiensis]|uniref:Alcohol dehydrogenase zinc-binding domain-containing protein n=1 Tax=Companilactobacillus kimchiensis TaxID=993692 RepID=A0A0R2LDI7_9LACO|nr:zinc-binding alcohol dehydrogenase family protein [Companilactobacillus kimchiensis]KRN98005.1 alcohol dehydrogenase zinc-binding domain-containing protein [Companilactobacillus kimchiensis]
MKAAIVTEAGVMPTYSTFKEPKETEEELKVNVKASALSNLTKMRALGKHYSSTQTFPIVAGTDGVGTLGDGTRVYFAMPTAPFGSLAEQTLVNKHLIVPIPDELDDVTAAAIANPGMSSWGALVGRAKFQAGQTVLINGATGSAGSLAVKIAYHLGAKKVIVAGRNAEKLAKLGADVAVSFDMTAENGAQNFETKLAPYFQEGIDVVLDYLWGDSALAIMLAGAEAGGDHTTKFISIGAASGQPEISLPSAVLRSSKIEILGSGVKSVSMKNLLIAIKGVFDWAAADKITIPTTTYDLKNIAEAWKAPLTPRAVIKVN